MIPYQLQFGSWSLLVHVFGEIKKAPFGLRRIWVWVESLLATAAFVSDLPNGYHDDHFNLLTCFVTGIPFR